MKSDKNKDLLNWCTKMCAAAEYDKPNPDTHVCSINGMVIHEGRDGCGNCPYNFNKYIENGE